MFLYCYTKTEQQTDQFKRARHDASVEVGFLCLTAVRQNNNIELNFVVLSILN